VKWDVELEDARKRKGDEEWKRRPRARQTHAPWFNIAAAEVIDQPTLVRSLQSAVTISQHIIRQRIFQVKHVKVVPVAKLLISNEFQLMSSSHVVDLFLFSTA
jgi:hypothetical protein